jgi:hypothetical protein
MTKLKIYVVHEHEIKSKLQIEDKPPTQRPFTSPLCFFTDSEGAFPFTFHSRPIAATIPLAPMKRSFMPSKQASSLLLPKRFDAALEWTALDPISGGA